MVAHRLDAGRNQLGFAHQARAEGAALHALARTAYVQIYFVVAVPLAELRAMRQLVGLAAAELQRDGMLFRAESEMAVDIAVDEGAGGDHLRVEARVRRELPHEEAVMAVGPVHHRRDANLMR